MQTPSPRKAIQVIASEHQHLSMVVTAIQRLVKLLGAGDIVPRPVMFRSMLFYIREYPEKLHHPKEERYLFAHLRHHDNQLDKVLDELEDQHAQGKAKLQDVEHAFTRFELMGESALPILRDMVDEYAQFSANHRRLEEEVILPGACRWLTEEEWSEVDEAFAANHDPFAGAKVEADFGRLYAMIVKALREP